MNRGEIKFCPQCGAGDLATKEITPNHILELYCPHCGSISVMLWFDRALVGRTVEHDPDSDTESW
jgi:Zn finger protein HypA/HybF involved in hydrogenase expression